MEKEYLELVGNTPMIKLKLKDLEDIDFYAKLEFMNPTGSVKDRAASYLIKKILDDGTINERTTLIESSSGNFGIALATFSKKYNLNFICVIDPNILPANELLIRSMGATVIKVTEPDENGGYLLSRIKKVNELMKAIPNSYWVNQYCNPLNAQAYYTLGQEICNEVNDIDYLFMGVSSGGTITGVSNKVKEINPNTKIIAVDIVGSVIFGGKPKKRYIPGIGSSMSPKILNEAKIDDVVMIDEKSTIEMCHHLLNEHSVFVGGSSGSVIAAVYKYFSKIKPLSNNKKTKIVLIFPDKGERYISTVYNPEWFESHFSESVIKNII